MQWCAGSPHLLYADDATIFVAPSRAETSTFARILNNFSEVTDLLTNVGKSLVAPIHCNDIDLGHILQNLSAAITTFTMKYLGLPLSVKRLKGAFPISRGQNGRGGLLP
jgi:hypothetical protein